MAWWFSTPARVAIVASALWLASSTAFAQASLIGGLGGPAGYGAMNQCLRHNDDGSSAPIDIRPFFPGGLRFFSATPHTALYVNTNGNITFTSPAETYTPMPFPVANQPMIAPFWADVDIRRTRPEDRCIGSEGQTCIVCDRCHNPTENGVWWHFEPGRAVITWDRVGRYDCITDNKRMSFQLVLTAVDSGCGGAGDFDVEFRFNTCQWEVGEASGDNNGDGFCQPSERSCTPAQSGFDAGNSRDFVALMGSRMNGIANRLCTMSNVGETGIWRFQIRSGSVLCPEAGDACNTGMMGVCANGRTNCVGTGTQCVPDVQASAERCNALDDDCNGTTDEGDDLCPRGESCVQGACRPACFEFGCSDGQVCTDDGLCVDPGCETITCDAGQRCEDGRCIGACDGVVCPYGRQCRGGACVDLCAGLDCDDCTACDPNEGTCAARCQFQACPGGQTCQADGRCIANSCANVTCAAGEYCRDGSCVDRCMGAACPSGQMCEAGECVRVVRPDGGVYIPRDGGGPLMRVDAGPDDVGMPDGGRRPPGRGGEPGCDCRAAPGASGSGSFAGLLSALAIAGVLAYRRRRRDR